MAVSREQIRLPSGHSFRVLRWSRNLREVVALFDPNCPTPIKGEGEHWHLHVEMELTLFTAGEGTRFVGDHIGPFSAGDLVLLGPKIPHHWYSRGPSAGLSVQWNFPPGHALWQFPEALALVPFFERASRGLEYTGATSVRIAEDLQEIVQFSGAERLGLFIRLLASLANAPSDECTPLSKQFFSLPAGSSEPRAMTLAARYITASFRDDVRLEEILRLTGMSKATFSRQFKKHYGKRV